MGNSGLPAVQDWASQPQFDFKGNGIFSPPLSYVPPQTLPYAINNVSAESSQDAPISAPTNFGYVGNMTPQQQSQPQLNLSQPNNFNPSQINSSQPLNSQQNSQPAQNMQQIRQFSMSQPPSLPAWAHVPCFLPPSSHIDALLQSALAAHRAAILVRQLDPPYPDYSALLDLTISTDISPLCAVITRAIRSAGFKNLAIQAAIMYTTHALMQWQANPLPETYERVPVWLRPGPEALRCPHALWAGQLTNLGMRERVISNGAGVEGRYGGLEFVLDWARNVDIMWPGREQLLIPGAGPPPGNGNGDGSTGANGKKGGQKQSGGVSLVGKELKAPGLKEGFEAGIFEVRMGVVHITQAFEKVVREENNWRLPRDFLARWPEMGDCVKTV
jgi:hypothetical protein